MFHAGGWRNCGVGWGVLARLQVWFPQSHHLGRALLFFGLETVPEPSCRTMWQPQVGPLTTKQTRAAGLQWWPA